MKTDHVRHLIDGYIDGDLDERSRRMVEEHLASCEACRNEADEIGKLVLGIRSLPREIAPPGEVMEGLPGITAAEPAPEGLFGLRKNGRGESAEAGRPGLKVMFYRRPVFYFRTAAAVAVIVCAGLVWRFFGPAGPDTAGDGLSRIGSSELTTTIIPPETTGVARPVGEAMTPRMPVTDPAKNRARPGEERDSGEVVQADRGIPEMAPVVPLRTSRDSDEGVRSALPPVKTSARSAEVLAAPAAGTEVPMRKSRARSTTTASTTGKITGQVIDRGSGDPVFGANVLVVGTTRGAVTDPDGKYLLSGVPLGTYTVRVSAIGYAVVEATGVKISAGETMHLNFGILTEEVPLSGVTVTADQQLANSQVTSGTQTVSKEAIEAVPNEPKMKDVEDVLKLQAGVAKQGTNLYLRGGRSGEVEYLIQGTPTGKGRYNFDAGEKDASGGESYDRIDENGFRDAFRDPKSTFSIDVDAASYANLRRYLNAGRRPPKDAVRIEEMVNYFTYDYPRPERGRPFSVTTEIAECPWNSDNLLLLVGIQGKKVAVEDLPPGNLVFLIDVSGSMQSANKLPLLRSAFRLLVNQLREEDRISIVVYAGSAGLVLPPTSGYDKQRILAAIDALEAGGSTAGGAGIRLAYSQARESFIEGGNNRVILATDGDFNVGVSSDEEMVRLITKERDDGIFLSVLGFGTGNLKDSKLEKLADKGNGNYAYIDNIQEAKRVFVGQLSGTLYTIAKDVKIQMEFNPDRVSSYRLIGYENRVMRNRDFRDDRKDAGELGAGHTVTALYEIVPADRDDDDSDEYAGSDGRYRRRREASPRRDGGEMATVFLRYKDPDATRAREIRQAVDDDRPRIDRASENLRFAAAVAEFGMLLRDSEFRGSASYRQVLRLAGDALAGDPGGYRGEFIRLVESAEALFGNE